MKIPETLPLTLQEHIYLTIKHFRKRKRKQSNTDRISDSEMRLIIHYAIKTYKS